jgi:hypothetical protein
MHAVISTPTYLSDAKAAGLSDAEMADIETTIGTSPLAGEPIVGTGGARKLRFAAPGRGKSGGYRVITYFAGDDVPVFLLALVSKGDRANISQAERNALRVELGKIADDYRAGVRRRVHRLGTRKE